VVVVLVIVCVTMVAVEDVKVVLAVVVMEVVDNVADVEVSVIEVVVVVTTVVVLPPMFAKTAASKRHWSVTFSSSVVTFPGRPLPQKPHWPPHDALQFWLVFWPTPSQTTLPKY